MPGPSITDQSTMLTYVRGLFYLVLAALLLLFLRWAEPVMLPLVLAAVILILLYSLYRWLGRYLPREMRWLTVMVTIVFAAAVVLILLVLLLASLREIPDKYPEYSQKARLLWQHMEQLADRYNLPVDVTVEPDNILPHLFGFFSVSVASLSLMTVEGVIILFLMVLISMEVDEWKSRLTSYLDPGLIHAIGSILHTVTEKIARFFFVRSVVSILTGVLGGVLLWALDVDFYLAWAFLIFILNYIPYIGSIVAVVPPAVTALLQYGLLQSILVLIGLAIINQILGNYIDPRLEGRVLSLSPVMVMLSIIFWGWAWGVPGAFLGIPLYITAVSICEQVPDLQLVARVFSRTDQSKF